MWRVRKKMIIGFDQDDLFKYIVRMGREVP